MFNEICKLSYSPSQHQSPMPKIWAEHPDGGMTVHTRSTAFALFWGLGWVPRSLYTKGKFLHCITVRAPQIPLGSSISEMGLKGFGCGQSVLLLLALWSSIEMVISGIDDSLSLCCANTILLFTAGLWQPLYTLRMLFYRNWRKNAIKQKTFRQCC